MAVFYAKTISNSINSPASVWTDSAYKTGATKEAILAAKSDNVTTIIVEGSDSSYTVGSWYDDLGVMQVTKIDGTNNGYFGPASEETVTEPKFVFGSHETGASIVDAVINNTPQTADLVKTFTIAEAVGAVFGSNDENNVHNIRDVYAKHVGNMAWVKGEIDSKTEGPGDRNWHPDENEG